MVAVLQQTFQKRWFIYTQSVAQILFYTRYLSVWPRFYLVHLKTSFQAVQKASTKKPSIILGRICRYSDTVGILLENFDPSWWVAVPRQADYKHMTFISKANLHSSIHLVTLSQPKSVPTGQLILSNSKFIKRHLDIACFAFDSFCFWRAARLRCCFYKKNSVLDN